MGNSTKRAGDFKVPFGKYKGQTLDEVFEDNPGYLDWLGSQTFIYGSLKTAVHRFLSIGYVQDEINRRFWDYQMIWDTDDRKIKPRDGYFIPSEQTAKKVFVNHCRARVYQKWNGARFVGRIRTAVSKEPAEITLFALGKATWLPVQINWRGLKKVSSDAWRTTSKKPDTDQKAFRRPGPQDPEPNWHPDQPGKLDSNRRPKGWISVGPASGRYESLARYKRLGNLTEREEELATDTTSSAPLTPMEAWELAADILRICTEEEWGDEHKDETCFEYIDDLLSRLPNWDRREQLINHLSDASYHQLREAYATRGMSWINTILQI